MFSHLESGYVGFLHSESSRGFGLAEEVIRKPAQVTKTSVAFFRSPKRRVAGLERNSACERELEAGLRNHVCSDVSLRSRAETMLPSEKVTHDAFQDISRLLMRHLREFTRAVRHEGFHSSRFHLLSRG